MAGIQVDGANQKLVLDSDGDTYLEAATDDTIKVYVAGAHDATISANAINVLSGTTLTIDSGATITNSGTANGFSSADPASADGDSLGTASLEWSDLFLADGGIIKFGNDQDVLLTHVADTGLLLNGTNVIQFNDASQNIGAPSNAILDINATDEIELNASLLDVNANLDVSGTYTGAGLMTTGGNIVIPDAGTIGSASDTDAIAIASDGDVTFSQKIGVITAHDLGSGIHVRTADSGASVQSSADELVLETNGSGGLSILTGTSESGTIMFGDSGDDDIGKIQYNHDNNGMFFFTNATQQVCILSDGDVGIGEANPAGKLEVKGDADTDIARFRTGTDGRQIKMMNASDTQVGGIAINNSDTQYITSSDYRLKENETSITDGITRLKTLKPYRFNFKSEPDRTVDGFFAHEVTAVPEAITGTKDGLEKNKDGTNKLDNEGNTIPQHQGIDQSKLVPLLTSALQEAITKIEILETENTDIKARLTTLEDA
jgi:hypothetical protein